MRAFGITALVVLSLLACSTPVVAGGWAMVRLDTTPGEVVVGVPWKFGFMVRQHDVSPTNDVEPVVTARHQETGDVITATAKQDGPIGHFVAELTFPRAGKWKWEIRPEPFAETALAMLTVSDHAGATVSYPASLYAGTCAALGDVAAPLSEVGITPAAVKSTQAPVAVGVSTVDVRLPDLVASDHAIRVSGADIDAAPIACADVGPATDQAQDEIVLGLHGWEDTANVGVAVLRGKGEETEISLYLLPDRVQVDRLAAFGETEQIDIVNDTIFSPPILEVAAGTTVIWTNTSEVAHTVTGDDLEFDDSGIIDPGQTFAYTFTEPGTYTYHCSPHPYMTGVIVVT
jgi:plastocyanin